jgi:hypothetical protein
LGEGFDDELLVGFGEVDAGWYDDAFGYQGFDQTVAVQP